MQFYNFVKILHIVEFHGVFLGGRVVCFCWFVLFIHLVSLLHSSTSVQRKNQSGLLTGYAFSQGSSNESIGLQLSNQRENFHATMEGLNMVNHLNFCYCKGLRVKHKMCLRVYIQIWGI